jgi:hypothetical protein
MILGKYHCTIDEITYNRLELLDFYNDHKHNIMDYGEYMQFLSPWKREFKNKPGMHSIAVLKTEGKEMVEYPVIQKYINMFNFEKPIQPRDVDIIHYNPGFSFHPHTDHYMQCGIMLPIIPEDTGVPISFYNRDGVTPVPNTNYEWSTSGDKPGVLQPGFTDDDIEYQHHYSNKHPTLFNGLQIHGVPTVTEERAYLRIKVIGEPFESVISKLELGTFCNPSK